MHLIALLALIGLMAYFLLFNPPEFMKVERASENAEYVIGIVVAVVFLLIFITLYAAYVHFFPEDTAFGKPTSQGGSMLPAALAVVAVGPAIWIGLLIQRKITSRR